jgi:hypothetical protein
MDILELLPEINEIRDPELRQKTAQIWEEAMEAGDWTTEEVNAIPFTLLAEDVNVTFIEHVRTVAKLCLATRCTSTCGTHGRRWVIAGNTIYLRG